VADVQIVSLTFGF